MRPYRTLIIDDEWLIRAELRSMLRDYPIIDIIGEAADVNEARALVYSLTPDLLFLDIQMPGKNGLQFLQEMEVKIPVIIISAFNEYLEPSQSLPTLGFLFKPIRKEKLDQVLQNLGTGKPSE
jgi:two-component system, LytTR family, response regulator